MDIEERAEKWAREYVIGNGLWTLYEDRVQALIAAYLAGVSQTQADYSAHYNRD